MILQKVLRKFRDGLFAFVLTHYVVCLARIHFYPAYFSEFRGKAVPFFGDFVARDFVRGFVFVINLQKILRERIYVPDGVVFLNFPDDLLFGRNKHAQPEAWNSVTLAD